MKIFVASWFFPPNTSSEGIVAYKLLRNSVHDYDVVAVSSHKWGYRNKFQIDDSNIHVTLLDTDCVAEWVERSVALFREKHQYMHYDAFMTRCMPREALEIGLTLKQEYRDVPWICSLADPVGNDPYVRREIQASNIFSNTEKKRVLSELSLPKEKWTRKWENHASNNVSDQFRFKHLQDVTLKTADLLIAPCVEQAWYMCEGVHGARKIHILPHSFDEKLFEEAQTQVLFDPSKVHFSFFGYSHKERSVRPYLEAAAWIRQHFLLASNQIQLHIFGNYEKELCEFVERNQIEPMVVFHGSVEYLESLALMKKSDCLLHVDTFFQEFEKTGGSIFLAGKLADYVGAERPILGITGHGSPSWNVIDLANGRTFSTSDVCGIAHAMMKIAARDVSINLNTAFRDYYQAKNVSKHFDLLLDEGAQRKWKSDESTEGLLYQETSPTGTLKELFWKVIRTVATSRLIMNDFTMGYIRRQKENHGMLFRIYERMMNNH